MSDNGKINGIMRTNRKKPIKKNPFKGTLYTSEGQWRYPGEITKIPGNTMATHGYGNIPLWVVPNNDPARLVMPNTGQQVFPNSTNFTEYPQLPTAQYGLNKEKYNMKRALELGYEPDEMGHWPSVDYESGEYLKSKKHDTAWKEYLYGYIMNPDQALNYDVRVNPEGYFGEDQLQYVPKKAKGGWLDAYNLPIAQYGIIGTPFIGLVNKAGNWLKNTSLNPYNWGVEDYSDLGNFSKAYEKAKKSGKEEFIFNGKRYNTKYAGTPRQEVSKYGVKGKPIHPMDIAIPTKTNIYPSFGRYISGHIEASVIDDAEAPSVNYSSIGNYPFGLRTVDPSRGEKTYFSYGVDPDKFVNKVASLPLGDYGFTGEGDYQPSTWNLFTNNCADNVCDAFGVPRDKGLTYPAEALEKIKEKYPTLDVTGRTEDDYGNFVTNLLKQRLNPNAKTLDKDVLNNVDKLTSIYYSPDSNLRLKFDIADLIQTALVNNNYELPKSYIKGDKNNLDNIIGPETEAAIQDWKKKNKKMYGGDPSLTNLTGQYRGGGKAPDPDVARDMLLSGMSHGHPLTQKQRTYLAEIAGTDENGNFLDEEGNPTDEYGNPVDSEGNLIENIEDDAMESLDEDERAAIESGIARTGGWLKKYAPGGVTDKPIEKEVGERLPKAQKGLQPTFSDSLALYNNAILKNAFYANNPDYEKLVTDDKGTDFKNKKVRKNLIKEANNLKNWIIKLNQINDFNSSNKYLGEHRFGTIPNTNLTQLGDVLVDRADTWFNPSAPPILIHPLIEPQGSESYNKISFSSSKAGDVSDIPYYDPIAVKPWPMLTAEERKARVEKYGTKGTPLKTKEDLVEYEKQVKASKPKNEKTSKKYVEETPKKGYPAGWEKVDYWRHDRDQANPDFEVKQEWVPWLGMQYYSRPKNPNYYDEKLGRTKKKTGGQLPKAQVGTEKEPIQLEEVTITPKAPLVDPSKTIAMAASFMSPEQKAVMDAYNNAPRPEIKPFEEQGYLSRTWDAVTHPGAALQQALRSRPGKFGSDWLRNQELERGFNPIDVGLYGALAARVAPTVLPYISSGLATNLPFMGSVPGATYGNLLTSSIIANAAMRESGLKGEEDPSTTREWEKYKSGEQDLNTTIANTGWNMLDLLALPELKPFAGQLAKDLQYVTTQTPIKNTWQYNPWRWKPNINSYYHRNKDLQNVINREKGILQSWAESDASKAYSELARTKEPGKINLKRGANPRMSFSKGVPLDARYSKSRYPGPYMIEVSGETVPFRASNKGVPVSDLPGSFTGSYNVPGRPISLDEAKFYKEDWLWGYKPISPKELNITNLPPRQISPVIQPSVSSATGAPGEWGTVESTVTKPNALSSNSLSALKSKHRELANVSDKEIAERLEFWKTPEGKSRLQSIIDNTPELKEMNVTPDYYVKQLENLGNANRDAETMLSKIEELQASRNNLIRDFEEMDPMFRYSKDELNDELAIIDDQIKNISEAYDNLAVNTKWSQNAFLQRNLIPKTSKPGSINLDKNINNFDTGIGVEFLPEEAEVIAGHEITHLPQLSTTMTNLDRELEGLQLLSEENPNLFSAAEQEEIFPTTFRSFLNKKGDYFKRALDYFKTGSQGKEKTPFLAEVRKDMMKKGIIKNLGDKITLDMLKKHYADYIVQPHGTKYPLRLYDIINNNSKNFKLLEKVINKLPVVLPAVGAGSYLMNQESSSPKTGEFKKGGWLNKYQ